MALTQEERLALTLDPYGMEAIRAAQVGKLMVTNAEGQQAFIDPNNKEILQIYRGLGFNPGSIAANSTPANNTKINKSINATAEKIKAEKIKADNAKKTEAEDLAKLHEQLRNMSKVDTSVKTPEGKTRVWNANGDSYLIDSGNRAQLIEARNKQYNPGNIAAMGSDFKNNQSVVTSINPVTQQPNAWVKPKSFQEWQDLNKIARNPDYEVGQTAPEGPDMARTGVPIHPVTGLRIEKGDNWNSYTEAPSGITYNNSNFDWNNDGKTISPTGNVAGLSQQEIDVLYGRPPSPVQPKQEVNFSGFADFLRNLGK